MKRSSSTSSRSGAATTGRSSPRRGRAASRAKPGRAPSRSASRKGPPRTKSARRSLPWPVYAVALLAFAAWSFYPALKVEYHEQREKARLEQELAALKERNSKLRAQVDRLKTPAGVEDLARRDLGFVEPGEHAYVVSDPAEPTATVEASAEPTSTLADRILDFVFAAP